MNTREWTKRHDTYEKTLLEDLQILDSEPHVERLPAEGCVGVDLWSLTEVGDLMAASGYGRVSSPEFERAFIYDSRELRRAWLGAIADAYALDRTAIAKQAEHLARAADRREELAFTDEWFVATADPVSLPKLKEAVHDGLTPRQVDSLLKCLRADSDWIAYSAAEVLISVSAPSWDSRELLSTDMSTFPINRGTLLHCVAILSGKEDKSDLLRQAAESNAVDRRAAAALAISIEPELDPARAVASQLNLDPDMAVRPKAHWDSGLPPSCWSCNGCRTVNDAGAADCSGCEDGVRPEAS